MLFKTPNTQHCAVDLIKLYDNTLNPYELQRFISSFRQTNSFNHQILSEQTDQRHITDLCGTYTMPLDVYSTNNRLLFYFISTHYAEITDDEQSSFNDILLWRKGFYAEYEFLSSLTKLDFITKNKSNQYLSGTECDQTIKSFSQGYGLIQSPNWPHPYKPQTSCTTYLLGLDDRYTLENVEIEFDQFDIDCQIASFIIYNASRIYDYRLRQRPSSLLNNTLSITHKSIYVSFAPAENCSGHVQLPSPLRKFLVTRLRQGVSTGTQSALSPLGEEVRKNHDLDDRDRHSTN